MSWLKSVCERRSSREEIDWLQLMGIRSKIQEQGFLDENGELLKEEYECVKKLGLKVEPKWFQELSDRQIGLLELLYDAIRDDFDLKHIFRSWRLLQLYGLKPMPRPDIVKRALVLSEGHELAFLWFLLDIWYRTFHSVNNGYCLNERLLMMAICHLDMITTLRGLNDVMPKAKKVEKKCQKLQRSSGRRKAWSPYLTPQPIPKIPSSRALEKFPCADPDIHPYGFWSDFSFVPKNEENRWFSEKSRNPRVKPAPKTSKERMMESILTDAVKQMNFFGAPSGNLCLKHQQEKQENRKQARLRALSDFNRSQFKSPLAQEILQQLEKDVSAATAELQRIMEEFQAQRIVQAFVQDMLTNAAAMRFVQPSVDCSTCQSEFEVYRALLKQQLEASRKLLDYGHEGEVEQQYFRAATRAEPFEFDFAKIYKTASECQTCPVKAAVKKALNDGENSDEEIEKIFTEMWQQELAQWNKLQQERAEKEAESEKMVEEAPEVLDVPQNSRKSIQRYLRRFLRELSKDSFYILPSLPDAHKLPVLESWVRLRFGMKISRERRQKILRHNLLQWTYLVPAWSCVSPPSNKQVCKYASDVTYDSHDWLHVVKNLMALEYERHLKSDVINLNRLMWQTFNADLCSPRMREVFYAYNPGAERDMPTRRPWLAHERRV